MVRLALAGALVASSFAFAAPALADPDMFEVFRRDYAEHTDRTAREAPAAERREKKRERIEEGRASARGEARPSGRTGLEALVARHAAANGIPYELAHGVVMVESRYNAKATGPGGYIGLMQIGYRTAKGMGYAGSRAALYDPETNLSYGMKYLGEAYRQAGGSMCGAVSKYQGGHGVSGVTKSGAVYCRKVKKFIARGVPSEARPVRVAERLGERS